MVRRLFVGITLPAVAFATASLGKEALPGLGGLIVPFIIILLLVALNGLYVAAEFAIIGVRPTQLESAVGAGNRPAGNLRRILQSPVLQDRYIATAQMGITISSLGLGMYSEPQIAHFVEPYLAYLTGLDLHSTTISTAGYLISLSFLTYLHIVVGEMIPKSLALSSPLRTALAVYSPMNFSQAVLSMPVRVLNAVGVALLKLLRIPPVEGHARLYSPEEIEFIVSESAQEGLINAREQMLVHNIFNFGGRQVREVMTPRFRMQAIAHDAQLPEILQLVTKTNFSRFPVYEGTLDNVVGILHIKDLVRHQTRTKGSFDIRLLWRPALTVPELYPVEKMLAVFKRQKLHMAIVLDEYSSTAGLVTLEDLVEEIVGELRDEFDKADVKIQRLPNGGAMLNGLTLISEVNVYFNLALVDENYDTIGGYVMGRLDRMARVGDTVEAGPVRLRVEAMEGKRISKVLLSHLK